MKKIIVLVIIVIALGAAATFHKEIISQMQPEITIENVPTPLPRPDDIQVGPVLAPNTPEQKVTQ